MAVNNVATHHVSMNTNRQARQAGRPQADLHTDKKESDKKTCVPQVCLVSRRLFCWNGMDNYPVTQKNQKKSEQQTCTLYYVDSFTAVLQAG